MNRFLIITASIMFNLFFGPILNAQQDKFLETYNRETIMGGVPPFMRDDKKINFKDVRPLLLKFNDSSAEFLAYKKKSTIANVLMIPAAILCGVLVSREDNDLNYPLALGCIGFGVTASIIKSQSNRHLQKSIWLYNRDILMESN